MPIGSGSALGTTVASDIAYAVTDHYLRGKAFAQTTQDKPLLRVLNQRKKDFPGGKGAVVTNVQGSYMSDTAGFLVGFSQDDAVTFAQAANILQVSYSWKEMHAGLVITETELKQAGISITDGQRQNEHTGDAKFIITKLLENRMDDYGESWSRAWQKMFWQDGSQDAKGVKGFLSIFTDSPTTGSTGGLSHVTYPWWQIRENLAIGVSEEEQTLTKFLRKEVRQLRRYGGRPNQWFGGSEWMEALEWEVQKKGLYTMEGFNKGFEIGVGKISINGIGTCEWDPSLDDMGMSKQSIVFDDRRIYWSPMAGEDDKHRTPERPYNYFVFLQSMTRVGTLVATQLNCMGRYGIA